jgi:hypothetical protein
VLTDINTIVSDLLLAEFGCLDLGLALAASSGGIFVAFVSSLTSIGSNRQLTCAGGKRMASHPGHNEISVRQFN